MPEGDAGPRPLWSGTISFGLVSVPVDILPATRSAGESLRMVSPGGRPLSRRYFARDGRRLESEDIVRGYEVKPDHFVVVEDEELERLAPERTRDIDLRVFVDVARIDPVHFDRPYFLTPAGNSTKAYRLLSRVMEESGRAGIATFVMRGKEYLVAILAENGVMRAETLRFSEEIRTPDAVGLQAPASVPAREVRRVGQEIRALSRQELDPEELSDTYSERLRNLVRKKARDRRGTVGSPSGRIEDASVIDLMQRLQRSLRGNGEGRATADVDEGLRSRTKADLYERAQELDIAGRSSMTKDELIAAIEGADGA